MDTEALRTVEGIHRSTSFHRVGDGFFVSTYFRAAISPPNEWPPQRPGTPVENRGYEVERRRASVGGAAREVERRRTSVGPPTPSRARRRALFPSLGPGDGSRHG
jgi:hypothetical protein